MPVMPGDCISRVYYNFSPLVSDRRLTRGGKVINFFSQTLKIPQNFSRLRRAPSKDLIFGRFRAFSIAIRTKKKNSISNKNDVVCSLSLVIVIFPFTSWRSRRYWYLFVSRMTANASIIAEFICFRYNAASTLEKENLPMIACARIIEELRLCYTMRLLSLKI